MLMRPLIVLVSWLVLHVGAACAQEVPAASFELIGGSGTHTGHASHVYYRDDRTNFFQFGGTVRLWKSAPVAPVLSYEYGFDVCPFGCGEDAVCVIAPDMSCMQFFDEPHGSALSVGVSSEYRGRVLGTLSIGAARYTKPATFLDANVGLSIFSHLAVVGDARHIVTKNNRGDRVWLFPLSAGLRVQ
jgi:hypothetical protein